MKVLTDETKAYSSYELRTIVDIDFIIKTKAILWRNG